MSTGAKTGKFEAIAQEAGYSRCATKKNRAQITFTFMVSAAMFIGLVIYVVSTVFNMVNPYFNAATQQESEAYAYMVSTLLLSDPGYWDNGAAGGTDWENHPQSTASLGLASSYYRLSATKLTAMSALTNEQIRTLLGVNHLYSFCIGQVSSQDCGLLNKTSQAFTGSMVTRYAVVENGTQIIPARIVVEVQ